MEFNIAFNSIFYISIFIFPGILLRRFFFSGEFNKEFSQGNLLERFLWTVFSSIFSLFFCAIFFFAIRYVFGKKLLPAISYETIKEVFDLLGSNEIPEKSRFLEIYLQFLILLVGIYFMSILVGFIGKYVVIKLNTSNIFSALKYRNYWYYFMRGKIEMSDKSNKRYWYTDAVVLVSIGESTTLYSGKIIDYFINPISNELESIFLEGTKRYKVRKRKKPKIIDIPGNVFSISSKDIINLNLTYVYRDLKISKLRIFSWQIIQLIYYIITTLIISFIWIEDIGFFYFKNLVYKILFALVTWLIIVQLKSIFKKLIIPSKVVKSSFSAMIIGILFFSFQYLWIFDVANFIAVFITTFIITALLIGIFINTKDKK